MARLTARILLLLAVLAVGRMVVEGFFRSGERKEVIVLIMPGADCVANTITPESPGEN